MSLITDPALLDELNAGTEKKKSAANQVTDKKLIDELNNKIDYTEKSAVENFMAPLRAISPEDWKKESIAYPVLQTMRGLLPFQGKQGEQDYTQGMAGIKKKGDTIVEGVKQIVTSPVETANQVYSAVSERPAETAGNIIKGAVYDPELLFTPGVKQAGQAVAATGQAIKSGAVTAGNVAEGAINTLGRKGTKPGQRATYAGQYESARQPAGTTYNTPENLQAWREGLIDTAELNKKAVQYTPEQAAALNRTGGMVPYTGQVARATGEALAEPYTRFSGYLPDLASAAIGYGLLGPGGIVAGPALNMARKGYGLYKAGQTTGAMRQLGDLGFEPLYSAELKAMQSGKPHPSVIGPATGAVKPPTPQAMAAAQINPAMATTPAAQAAVNTTQAKAQTVPPSRQLGYTPPTMYVAPEGVAGTNLKQVEQTALQQRYAPQPVTGAVAPQPEVVAPPVKTTKEDILARLSAAKNAEPAPVTTVPLTNTEALARMQASGKYRAPKQTEPIYKNAGEMRKALIGKMPEEQAEALIRQQFPAVEPTPKPAAVEKPKRKNVRQEDRVKELEAERTKGMTAEELAADEAAVLARLMGTNKLSKTIKGSGGRGTMGMMTQNAPLEMIYTSGKKGQQAIQNAPWLDKADYDTAIFNRSIGFDKNNQFIAKTRTENGGSIVTAADKKSSTEAVQFPDKSEVMIVKDLQNEGSYTVDIKSYGINKKYTFDIPYGPHGRSQKLASEPMNVEIYDIPAVGNKRGKMLASWDADADWTIVQKNKDGSYQTVPWYEIEKTKNHPLKEKLDGLRKETGLSRHEDNGFNDAQVSSDIQYWENKIKELKEGK